MDTKATQATAPRPVPGTRARASIRLDAGLELATT